MSRSIIQQGGVFGVYHGIEGYVRERAGRKLIRTSEDQCGCPVPFNQLHVGAIRAVSYTGLAGNVAEELRVSGVFRVARFSGHRSIRRRHSAATGVGLNDVVGPGVGDAVMNDLFLG